MRRSIGAPPTRQRAPRVGVARVVVVVYLATYLAWAGPLTGASWAGGGHATPEHWAYHLLLEQLGFHRHHGPVVAAPAGAAGRPSEGRALVPPPPSPLIVAGSFAPAVAADSPVHQPGGQSSAWLLAAASRLTPPGREPPLDRPAQPPEHPPPTDR